MPEAENGTITRTGRVGQGSAAGAEVAITPVHSTSHAAHTLVRLIIRSSRDLIVASERPVDGHTRTRRSRRKP